MGNRIFRLRPGFGGAERIQARPTAGLSRRGPGPRASKWLGWLAAAAAVALIAFFVGRAGSEIGTASPTPSSSPPPLVLSFGTALDPVSGEASNPTNRFRAGDPIAYSVRLPASPGVDSILVEVARLDPGGQTVVQQPSRQGILANSRVIAFTFAVSTAELLTTWGPGDYTMRIYLPGTAGPFATGGFTLVETPTAS
jgi:hypothetical protein